MTLRPIHRSDLQRLASRANITLAPEEVDEFEVLADALLETLAGFDAVPAAPPSVVPATRQVLGRPGPDTDPLNAIVRRCSVRASTDGLLAGKRIGLKDLIPVAGVPMTCGSTLMQGFTPESDAYVTRRLLEEGAEIVAILNMDALAFSGGGETSHYGGTANPWDRTRTAAGSSGGSAAALFYDDIDITFGTDDGGSIRLPAAWCGVLGHKPTHSLVPFTGIPAIDHTFSHVGPMARNVDDLALALQVVAGPDPDRSDPRQYDVPDLDFVGAVEAAPETLEGLRIGLVEEAFAEEAGVEPETASATLEAVTRLEELGATVGKISIPEHLTGVGLGFALFIEGETAMTLGFGNGYHYTGRYSPDMARAFGHGLAQHADDLPPSVKIALLIGHHLRESSFSELYFKAQNLRGGLTAAYDRALETYDVLLMPTATVRAHPFMPDASISERVLRGWSMLGNTTPLNMTGHPSLSVPAAESGGLPVGVLLSGARFSDPRLLAIARTYERQFGWLPQGHPVL